MCANNSFSVLLRSLFIYTIQIRFITHIVATKSYNDEHLTEFQQRGGISLLLKILCMPNLPLDFSNSPILNTILNAIKQIVVSTSPALCVVTAVVVFNLDYLSIGVYEKSSGVVRTHHLPAPVPAPRLSLPSL